MPYSRESIKTFNEKSKTPNAPRDNTVDTYHGQNVPDPFRPLEDLKGKATTAYVDAQNKRFFDFIGHSPDQDEMAKMLSEIQDYARESLPMKHGPYYFTSYNDGKSAQSIYQVRKNLKGKPRTLINPNKLNKKGTTALSGTFPSPKGKYLAYLLSDNGSDAQTLYVMNVKTGKTHKTKIEGCRFTSVVWDADEKGFKYTYPGNDDLQRLVVKEHKIGRAAKHDEIIFERKDLAESFCSVGKLSDAEHKKTGYEYATVGVGTNAWNEFWLKKPDGDFELFFKDEKSYFSPIGIVDGKIYATTNRDSPRGRIVAVDIQNPSPSKWQEIIAEDDQNLLKWGFFKDGQLMINWSEDTASAVTFHKMDGTYTHKMPLPIQSTVGFGQVDKDRKTALVTIGGFASAGDKYIYNFEQNTLSLWQKSHCPVDLTDAVIERHFATSKDGTKVPMTIIRRKDVELDGTAATKLYGYGGFNVPLGPGFSFSTYNWVKEGGIYVQANLRGGGEFGKDWYDGGRLRNKQNVFDDFAACAEYLIDQKFTKPERLTINGGSNGGLLTLATMLQRPELFGAVTSHVPVADMYRFHKFTYGAAWKSDYGDVEGIKADFNAAAKYSPLHNVKKGVKYPPTLVMTGDSDDRVVPSHAYKFVATLNETSPETLGLLYVTKDAGHGAGKSKEKAIAEQVHEHAFLVRTLGPIDQKEYKIAFEASKKGPNAKSNARKPK